MITAFRCSYCNLVFEGLLGSNICPKCDSSDYTKKAFSYNGSLESLYGYTEKENSEEEYRTKQ